MKVRIYFDVNPVDGFGFTVGMLLCFFSSCQTCLKVSNIERDLRRFAEVKP